MKFGAGSDFHGILPIIEPCDIFLIAGDISPLNIQRDYYAMEDWLLTVFVPWINKLPCTHVIMTPGNHDFIFKNMLEPDIYKTLTKPTKGKLEVLYNQECNVVIEDEVIKIFGTPYCNEFGPWPFMEKSEVLLQKFSEIPKNCDIVIAHAAPKVADYGKIQEGTQKGKDAGSSELAQSIKDKQPSVCLFGHIHSGNHKLDKVKGYGKTLFANVSYVDEFYKPTNNILYFEYTN